MRITNWKLLESLETSITEYNDQFWKTEDSHLKIDGLEYSEDWESAEVSEETLKKLQSLRISLIEKDTNQEELDDMIIQLSKLLDKMKLTLFNFNMMKPRGSQASTVNMSFLDYINKDIKNISMTGIDLSQENSSRFARFKDLAHLSLQKCNISNPQIVSEIKPEVFVSLERNKIAPEHYKEALELINKSNGRIKFSDTELQTISQIYYTSQVQLKDYLKLRETINLDSIPELHIKFEEDFDFSQEEIIDILNGKRNITLITTPKNLSKIDSNGGLIVPTKIIIKNASELTIGELSKHQCVSTVQMNDGSNTEIQQGEPYSREEYEKVRSKIDQIISQIDFPEENDTDREKKIFSQIYKILGNKISYDSNAISETEKNNERLQITCRNLLGGLLEDKCVCAGYADILRNTLACAGIYSEYVGSMPDLENGVPFNLKDPGGHAWNLVQLDGQKYWTDLTWDANNIKAKRYPLPYCLKSTKGFKHDSFKKRLEDEIKDPCLESIAEDEQIMLFTGRESAHKTAKEKQENVNVGYLSNCVTSIAYSGLTSAVVRNAGNTITQCTEIQNVNETEVADGRS